MTKMKMYLELTIAGETNEFEVEVEGHVSWGCKQTYSNPAEPIEVEDLSVGLYKKTATSKVFLDITDFLSKNQINYINEALIDRAGSSADY